MRIDTREKIEALGQRRLELIEQLPRQPMGLVWCSEHTQIADEIATVIFDGLTDDLGTPPELSLIATGGFGRSELCPRSDIDITIVPGDETSPELDGVIRRLFQEIHWAYCTVLRLDVGYAYRLLSDASGLDAKTRTGLMDMRLLAGSEILFRQMQENLLATFPAGEFVLAKVEERQSMYERYHDTPYVIEPHLKEGAGGLRDFHCASWIGEAIGERAARPTASYDLVIKFRNLLHYCARKPQDTLSRVRQGEIGEILGVTPVDLVAQFTEAGQDLHNIYLRSREKLDEARFTLSPGVVSVGGEVRVLPGCTIGSAAVGIATATKLNLRVSDLPAQASSGDADASAAFALASGEKTLRNLDRCTLLDQLLPELTRCRNLSGGDDSHTYTVMEHTLRVVRNLDSLEPPGFLGELKSSVIDIEPLYMAALLHDVGKIDPSRSHSEAGSEIAQEVMKRWQIESAAAEITAWLVKEHLTLARFLRIRDIAHPSTILEFAEIVQTPERLKLLTLLTWADVDAVGVGAWTPAQETFLRILYQQTLLRLQGEISPLTEVAQSRQRLLKQLGSKTEDPTEVQEFLDSLPAYYLAGTNAEVIRFHMALVGRARKGEITIEHHSQPDLGATELTVCCQDSPGLLSHILGTLYAQELSLLGIRACTTDGTPPIAIDVFTVSFGGRPAPHATINRTAALLREVIAGERQIEQLLLEKNQDPYRRQQVFQWTFSPGHPAILEVRSPRGRGMAYRFSTLFARQGWNILAARVGQWAGTGSAAFYLTDEGGAELSEEKVAAVFADQVESKPTG